MAHRRDGLEILQEDQHRQRLPARAILHSSLQTLFRWPGRRNVAKCGLPELTRLCYACHTMSTVQEIEAAIQALPATEREKLVADLPGILPELNGDTMWENVLSDPRPRPALTALGDEIAAQFKANPSRFAEIQDRDFDSRS
jgi:hypothetical protein